MNISTFIERMEREPYEQYEHTALAVIPLLTSDSLRSEMKCIKSVRVSKIQNKVDQKQNNSI